MKNIKELREESNGQTRLLYYIGYYDGPLTGIMLWNGEKVYFSHEDDEDEKVLLSNEELDEAKKYYDEHGWEDAPKDWNYDYIVHRYYNVYRIPKDILDTLDERHSLFEKYVASYTSYDENGKTTSGKPGCGPYKGYMKFYEMTKNKDINIDVSKLECIGKFER